MTTNIKAELYQVQVRSLGAKETTRFVLMRPDAMRPVDPNISLAIAARIAETRMMQELGRVKGIRAIEAHKVADQDTLIGLDRTDVPEDSLEINFLLCHTGASTDEGDHGYDPEQGGAWTVNNMVYVDARIEEADITAFATDYFNAYVEANYDPIATTGAGLWRMEQPEDYLDDEDGDEGDEEDET